MEVAKKVVAQCPDCGFTDASIDKQSFSCYPNSPSLVTYTEQDLREPHRQIVAIIAVTATIIAVYVLRNR